MADGSHRGDAPSGSVGSVEAVAARLAQLLAGPGGGLRDPSGRDLVFADRLEIRPLERASHPPAQAWAVDGGQALVADARCLQLFVTRAARVCWAAGRTTLEEELPMQTFLLGLGEDRATLAGLGAPVRPDSSVDVNLVREWGEWAATATCVAEAVPGSLVLHDGDLLPDWRMDPLWLAGLMDTAADRSVVLAGVTKHTSLSWGGAPLLSVLEGMAPPGRSMWWAPVARTSPSAGPGVQVVVACLDPDARFAFRVDLPGDVDPAGALAVLSTLCDDAAFPGYPFPLTGADRLAACPSWVRDEVWSRIDDLLGRAGVPAALRERAFTDRHRLMERH